MLRIRMPVWITGLLFVSGALFSYMRLSLSPGLEPYGDALGYNVSASFSMDMRSFIKTMGPGLFTGVELSFASAGNSNLTFYDINGGLQVGYRIPLIGSVLNLSPYATLGAGYYYFKDTATNVDRTGFLVKPAVQIEYMITPQFSASFDFGARFVLMSLLTNFYCPAAYVLSLNISYYFQSPGEKAPQAKDDHRQLVQDIETIIRNEKLQGTVSQNSGNEVNLNLSDVLFETGKDSVSGKYLSAIKAIAVKVRDYQNLQVSVEGHTDDQGDDVYNSVLSAKRARNVSELFIAFGVSSAQITYKGWGKERPLAPNNSEINRAKNRRVEIRFIWK